MFTQTCCFQINTRAVTDWVINSLTVIRITENEMSCLMIKPTKWHVRPAKTQISLGIRLVWSESSLSAWRNIGSSATHWVHCDDSQTGRMPRLIWVFAGRTCHIVGFVMRRLKSRLFSSKIWSHHFYIFTNENWATAQQNQQNQLCIQQRLRSAWASAQSDKSLHCVFYG